jgi:very-short-patch-repair endonuclease
MKHQINNKKELEPYRKELRNNSTTAEMFLWNFLKNKQLAGRKFRRQHSVENCILDFYCPAERLAIELDGQSHYEPERIEKDKRRDAFLLHNFEIRTLRFENKYVFEQTDAVLREIEASLGFEIKITHTNHPGLRPTHLGKEGRVV